MSLFSKLIAKVDFYKEGSYLFTSDSIIGSAFTLTGFKPGKFSINEDTRHGHGFSHLVDVIKNIFVNNYVPSAWLIRKVLEEENTW